MLLDDTQFRPQLRTALQQATTSITILSAYVKLEAAKWIAAAVREKSLPVTIVARWQKQDLLSGASDLAVYEFCREAGWCMKVDPRLHGKAYWVDHEVLFVGSANLTQRGIGIECRGNYELTAKLVPNDIDKRNLASYLSSCRTITDALYAKLTEALVVDAVGGGKSSPEWPSGLARELDIRYDYLWVEDLMFTTPDGLRADSGSSSPSRHDYELLGVLPGTVDEATLRAAFLSTKAYAWLKGQFDEGDNRSIRFGRFTAMLHDSLLDNPSPYRRQVKEFVQNLFSWVRFLGVDEWTIERHARTESLTWCGGPGDPAS